MLVSKNYREGSTVLYGSSISVSPITIKCRNSVSSEILRHYGQLNGACQLRFRQALDEF
jgi:hypothetical protein